MGDYLIVALNSDDWLIKKKGKFFMPFSERETIISNLDLVDQVIDFQDDELGSCSFGLEKVKTQYPDDKIIFCNGGDRKEGGIPEDILKDELGIGMIYNVGGEKTESSSGLISRAKDI